MTAKLSLFLVVLTVSFLVLSCVSDPNIGKKKSAENFTEIQVPVSFDWKTTQNVVCNFTSNKHVAQVSISMVDAKEPFAEFLVGQGVEPVTVSLPQSEKAVVVNYTKVDGESVFTKLFVSNGSLAYVVPEDSQSVDSELYAVRKSKASNAQDDNSKPSSINIPATGLGTVMFEDLWPNYGDYDFNDMVINYRFRLGLQNQNKVNMLFGTIRINAIGGSLPYELFLQLDGVKGGAIYLDTPVIIDRVENNAQEVKITHLNQGNQIHEPALFAFTGVKANAKRPQGGEFLNTARGYELKVADMVRVDFMISFKNSIAIEDLDLDKFNFFIARESDAVAEALQEIHLGGFAPSTYGEELYETIKNQSSLINRSDKFYYSNKHLVWGINIADEVPHVYEKVPFITAYPNFVTWAQSGGKTDMDWYKKENRIESSLVPML